MAVLQKFRIIKWCRYIFEKNKIDENFHKIIYSVGRYNDKYYGIGLVPYTVEFL